MKTNSFEEACNALSEFDKTFDRNDFDHCVTRCFLLLKKTEAQCIEDEIEFTAVINRWAIEQAIINRAAGVQMLRAGIEYVERIQAQVFDI